MLAVIDFPSRVFNVVSLIVNSTLLEHKRHNSNLCKGLQFPCTNYGLIILLFVAQANILTILHTIKLCTCTRALQPTLHHVVTDCDLYHTSILLVHIFIPVRTVCAHCAHATQNSASVGMLSRQHTMHGCIDELCIVDLATRCTLCAWLCTGKHSWRQCLSHLFCGFGGCWLCEPVTNNLGSLHIFRLGFTGSPFSRSTHVVILRWYLCRDDGILSSDMQTFVGWWVILSTPYRHWHCLISSLCQSQMAFTTLFDSTSLYGLLRCHSASTAWLASASESEPDCWITPQLKVATCWVPHTVYVLGFSPRSINTVSAVATNIRSRQTLIGVQGFHTYWLCFCDWTHVDPWWLS